MKNGSFQVVVYHRDRNLYEQAVKVLARGFRLTPCGTIQDFRSALNRNHAGVLAVDAVRPSDLEAIDSYVSPCGYVPLVCVTRGRPDNLALLRSSQIADVVTIGHLMKELRPIVRKHACRTFYSERILATGYPTGISRLLAHTAYAVPPPRSLKLALAALGINRKTEWVHYSRGVLPAVQLPLKYVQEAIAVARTVAGKAPHLAWSSFASTNGFSLEWLRTAAARQTGFRLNELNDLNVDYLILDWIPALLHFIATRLKLQCLKHMEAGSGPLPSTRLGACK